jgi:hypothetical protein
MWRACLKTSAHALTLTLLVGVAAAQDTRPPGATARPIVSPTVSDTRCAEVQDWLDAERNTPGILLDLAREAVRVCLERKDLRSNKP